MELIVSPDGTATAIYDETLDLRSIGRVSIRRASHVEPTEDGQWMADMGPCGGPILGPFPTRSEALAAEVSWLRKFLGCSL